MATRILKVERSEEKTRLALTDFDIKGRDVVTLICETNEVGLFDHPYIEKLADEVWDGPYQVERSPLWLNSSYIAIGEAFESSYEFEDPLEIRDSFGKENHPNPKWQKLSSWGFSAWSQGIMVRYFNFILVSFLLAVYILWFCISLQGLFARAIFLTKFLYNGDIDPTPLDGRITYSCFP